jgi:hypothetical protein
LGTSKWSIVNINSLSEEEVGWQFINKTKASRGRILVFIQTILTNVSIFQDLQLLIFS